jgi:hypothetical protein
MKKFFVALGIISLFSVVSMAATVRFVPQTNQCVYIASMTKTNDTAQYITDSRYLKSIVISSSTAGGFVTVYNSTWTAENQVLPAIDMGTKGVYEVDLYMSNGITYTTTGNGNGVSFIYRVKE